MSEERNTTRSMSDSESVEHKVIEPASPRQTTSTTTGHSVTISENVAIWHSPNEAIWHNPNVAISHSRGYSGGRFETSTVNESEET